MYVDILSQVSAQAWGRRGQKFCRRGGLMYGAIIDQDGVGGEVAGICRVMCDHQHSGLRFGGDSAQQPKHLGFQRGTKGGEGFVQQQDGAGSQQDPGKGDPALLTAGQISGAPSGHATQPDLFHDLCDTALLRCIQPQIGTQAQPDILCHAQMWKEILVLKQKGYRSLTGRRFGDILAPPQDVPGIRRQEAADHRKQGGFP